MCAPRVPTFHIDGPDSIAAGAITHLPLGSGSEQRMPGWLPDRPLTVGLTAGASTPDSIVGAVIERILSLRGRGAVDLMNAVAAAEPRMKRTGPTELHLTLAPQRRFEAVDINARIASEAGDLLHRHARALYCSLHTTAGYLEQSLSARLRHDRDSLSKFIGSFGEVFPQGAEYSPRPHGAAQRVERGPEGHRAAQRATRT